MLDKKIYETGVFPTWCPGCGNFGIWNALKRAYAELELNPKDIFMVFGIGCSGNGVNFFNCYSFHALHGRTLPVATGTRLTNNKLNVVAAGGDGDGYGIGVGHFIHSLRRNLNITYIVHNNQVYGLTTGQTSPTSARGFKTKSTPAGVIEQPLNPLALAIDCGGTFVARGYAGDMLNLAKIFVEAIEHVGFSLVDVLQPCVTWNKVNTYAWYKDKVYKLDDVGHDPTDKDEAYRKAWEWGDKIPTGVFYKSQNPTYESELPQIAKTPLFKHDISSVDIAGILNEFY